MAYTYRRATRAMSITSSTTAAAFLANVFSPIMPIRSFGIYAGIIVFLNFILVICIFPSATIIYENYLVKICRCQIYCCEGFGEDDESEITEKSPTL